MKFLLDVCASSRRLKAALSQKGHDVQSALEIDRKATDEVLLAHAVNERRVLITLDKDFGELVYLQHRPHGSIVRLVGLTVDDQVTAITELLDHYSDVLETDAVIVVTRDRIRIRH